MKNHWLCRRDSRSLPSPTKFQFCFQRSPVTRWLCTCVWHTHTKPFHHGESWAQFSSWWCWVFEVRLWAEYCVGLHGRWARRGKQTRLGKTLSGPMSWGLLGNFSYSPEGFGLNSSLGWSLLSNVQNCPGSHRRTNFLHGAVVTFASIWPGNTCRNALPCNILYNFILFGFPIIGKANK